MTNYRFTSAELSELKEATLYYEGKEFGLGRGFWMKSARRSIESCAFHTPGIRYQRGPGVAEHIDFLLGCSIRFELTRF
jgi:hypothetical protein